MNTKIQLIKAENYQKQQVDLKFALAQQIGNTSGFYKYYFDTLPHFASNKKCFDNVNELYHSVFSEYRYSEYDTFRKKIPKYLNYQK